MVYKRDTPENRFWSKVRKAGPDDCWTWLGVKDEAGYGRFMLRTGKFLRSHRASVLFATGSLPDSLDVLHRCDNPSCVNPKHLRLGTHAENMADMVRRGRSGSMPGEIHPMARLTDEAVEAILLDDRYYKEIAADHDVHLSMIGLIKTGKNWTHVRPDIPRRSRSPRKR